MWWSFKTFSSLGKGIHPVICDIVGWNTFEMDWWSVILIFSSSRVSSRAIKCWQWINLSAWVLSGSIKYCILEHSIIWGSYLAVSDGLSWKQSGRRDVWWFRNADSSLGKGIYPLTIRTSDIVGWNPTELNWWNFSSWDVSGWTIDCWSIQRLGFIGKWFNPCARGPNGNVRYRMPWLDWQGTLVDFRRLKHIHRTLCWSVQAFCLPRKRVDTLTNGTGYQVEFVSSGWWEVFLYCSSDKTAIGGEWWLTFQFRIVFSGKKEVQEQVLFGSFSDWQSEIWTWTTSYFSYVFSVSKRLLRLF